MIKYFFVFFCLIAQQAFAGQAHQVPANVISVYDGDTIRVEAFPWPGQINIVNVRVNGIDTPEIYGKCEEEKEAAIEARDYVRSIVGEKITLIDPRYDKYAGRVLAYVILEDGTNLTDLLINEGIARPYNGGKREGWCQ